ncbi:MAG: phosphoserine phosphatase SerB [Alphaproteobacteria bacterium]|nr:phosphoserine phosphatase SerB [Alphaproteobacteria bacterium]
MAYALVLTRGKDQGLSAALIRAARDAAAESGAEPGVPLWLGAETACEIPCGAAPASLLMNVRLALCGNAIDANAVPTAHRRKRLLLADMDSTIIGCECIDEIADFAGVKEKVAGITERAMRGELVFEDALRERVALLKGLPETTLEQVFLERVRLNPGARTLVATMAASGATTALVSGGFTFFTTRVATAAGFSLSQANTLLAEHGVLTGRVKEPILGRTAKLEMLLRLRAEHRYLPEETLVVGDGANDLDMIGAAGLGVAYHAKPVVAEAAGARIDHGDLTTLLYLQGYREAELVQA